MKKLLVFLLIILAIVVGILLFVLNRNQSQPPSLDTSTRTFDSDKAPNPIEVGRQRDNNISRGKYISFVNNILSLDVDGTTQQFTISDVNSVITCTYETETYTGDVFGENPTAKIADAYIDITNFKITKSNRIFAFEKFITPDQINTRATKGLDVMYFVKPENLPSQRFMILGCNQ